MAILAFQKPDKVIMIQENAFSGKFEFRPLNPATALLLVTLCAVFCFLHLKDMQLHR